MYADQTKVRGSGRRPRLDRRNVYSRVADDIVAMLRDGHIKPGDPLPTERELVEAYGVGRSSAREAVRVLESKGLIVNDSRGMPVMADPVTALNGAIELVVDLHRGTLRDLYELRRMLEIENAALAAERRSDGQLEEMSKTIDGFQAAIDRDRDGDPAAHEAMVSSDVLFHMTVASASGNPLALTIMEGIRGLLTQAHLTVVDVAGIAGTSLRQHRLIYAAIEAGAVQAARSAMHDHLQQVERTAEALLECPAINPLAAD
jgi:GntR family transcriptional regulator, transcriptional repressor for pyruvate dehydrogenase complex